MKEKINEEVLCVLRKDDSSHIIIDFIAIINPFTSIVNHLTNLCDNQETTIQEIVNYIQKTEDFEQLTAHYRYCISLSNAYQGFSANNQYFILQIKEQYELILFNSRESSTYDIEKSVQNLKSEIKEKYILWCKAFSISKTYKLCHEDETILAFSHRMNGWSNPKHQLTPNFSVEIKTNFGYGSVSYFYTKLKYKNIEITPFSEWIDYEFARFSEIIRYSQSHLLMNKNWLEAMEFSRDACNLSLTDEIKFIEKHIIDECEKMVGGLEDLFNKENFTFKNRDRKEYNVDKKGHVLMEFRGEKISGALDFISKILEFEGIAEINNFIIRIENCNRIIQPMLIEEAKIIKIKIKNLTKKKKKLHPKYIKVVKKMNNYNTLRNELQSEMIINNELNIHSIDNQKLEYEFNRRFPAYQDFKEEYNCINKNYRILAEQIQNNTKIINNITSYNKKILKYFGNNKTFFWKRLKLIVKSKIYSLFNPVTKSFTNTTNLNG